MKLFFRYYLKFLSFRRLHKLLIFSFFLFIFFAADFCVAKLANKKDDGFELFKVIFNIVKSEYVEDLSDTKIMENAVQGMVSGLDPHSCYLDEKAYQNMKSATKGEFGGLGIEVTMENSFLKVVAPYEDSPAFKAGIKSGDYIAMIDGKLVKGMTLIEASEKLRGEPGSKVTLKIYRDNSEILEFIVEREIIKIKPVKSILMGEGSIGYIRVSIFNEKAADAVKGEWDLMSKSSGAMLGLILDLRSNPGGILTQAKDIADLFLSGGDIVTVKSRNKQYNQTLKAEKGDITKGLPIVVLINEGSASASEIVAGALQDNKRALVVGAKSFGKGSVQKLIPLFNGGALKVTTSLYYTPSGTSIQAHGIIPDVEVGEAVVVPIKKSKISISESSLTGHLSKKAEKNNDNKIMDTAPIKSEVINSIENKDFQLVRAIEILKVMSLYKKAVAE